MELQQKALEDFKYFIVFLIYLIFIAFFSIIIESPYAPFPLQSPYCCPCPWVFFPLEDFLKCLGELETSLYHHFYLHPTSHNFVTWFWANCKGSWDMLSFLVSKKTNSTQTTYHCGATAFNKWKLCPPATAISTAVASYAVTITIATPNTCYQALATLHYFSLHNDPAKSV